MVNLKVAMFGMPAQVTDLKSVDVELNDGAKVKDVVAELRRKIPGLEGAVITPGDNRLTEMYAFNINGQFHYDDSDLRLKNGDRLTLLLLATGG